MSKFRYDKDVPKKKKINWRDLLQTDDAETINPNNMDPIDRMYFIDGIYNDYKAFDSQSGDKMESFSATYKVILSELIKYYGH